MLLARDSNVLHCSSNSLMSACSTDLKLSQWTNSFIWISDTRETRLQPRSGKHYLLNIWAAVKSWDAFVCVMTLWDWPWPVSEYPLSFLSNSRAWSFHEDFGSTIRIIITSNWRVQAGGRGIHRYCWHMETRLHTSGPTGHCRQGREAGGPPVWLIWSLRNMTHHQQWR